MSRSPLLHMRVTRNAMIAIGIIALTAACDRESPTDVRRPPAAASLYELPSPGGDPQKPVSGYEVKSFGIDVVGGQQGVVEVLCSPGNRALGGGFQIGGPILIDGPDVAVYESSPRVTSGTDGWRLNAANRGTETRRFDVWVICAPF